MRNGIPLRPEECPRKGCALPLDEGARREIFRAGNREHALEHEESTQDGEAAHPVESSCAPMTARSVLPLPFIPRMSQLSHSCPRRE